MSIIRRLYNRFWQFGGFRLVWEYIRMGLLQLCCKEIIAVLLGRRKPMEAYGCVMGQVGQNLKRKYLPVLDVLDSKYSKEVVTGNHSHHVWVCWMQGIKDAPQIVKVCCNSLSQLMAYGCKVNLIDENNWRKFVELPDDIVRKWERGRIPTAQFTDILRLELLIKYGGTWIDSTVLYTGGSRSMVQEYLDADLFMFQQLRKNETRFLGISNWFITSCPDNWVLKELRDMLYQYWSDYDCVIHYYMFHLFFGMIMERHPEVAAKMPRHGNGIPHYLQRRMGGSYDEEWMQELKKRTCFHKLSYRLDNHILESKDTFYDVVIKNTFEN